MDDKEFYGRLPETDKRTTNVKEYTDAWEAIGLPIADATGTQLYAFDPDIALIDPGRYGRATVTLPLWFAKRFVRALKGR